jgi:hypothetical protein
MSSFGRVFGEHGQYKFRLSLEDPPRAVIKGPRFSLGFSETELREVQQEVYQLSSVRGYRMHARDSRVLDILISASLNMIAEHRRHPGR